MSSGKITCDVCLNIVWRLSENPPNEVAKSNRVACAVFLLNDVEKTVDSARECVLPLHNVELSLGKVTQQQTIVLRHTSCDFILTSGKWA